MKKAEYIEKMSVLSLYVEKHVFQRFLPKKRVQKFLNIYRFVELDELYQIT